MLEILFWLTVGWMLNNIVKWANRVSRRSALKGKHLVTFSSVVNTEMEAILLLERLQDKSGNTEMFDVSFEIKEI